MRPPRMIVPTRIARSRSRPGTWEGNRGHHMTAPPPPELGPHHPQQPQASGASPSLWHRARTGLRAHPTSNPTANIILWSVLGLVWVLIIGGVAASQSSKSTADKAVHTSIATPSSTASDMPSDTAAPSETDTSTTSEPAPLETTGGVSVNAAGAVLPDPKRTPGAINPDVTQDTIASTICVSGWTATVRPPSSYTTALKQRQLASGYAYRGDTATSDYEEDHLISLELGGSPATETNLWPEPYVATDGAHVKDSLENKLHSLVCAGTIQLGTAQHAIAANWWTAYLLYVGTPTATTYSAPTPAAQPPATTTTTSLSCSASMTNAHPAQYSSTDVIVHTTAGATVTATAHYKSTNTTHTGTAASNGVADIKFSISRATIGYTVQVEVTTSLNGATRSCSTSFTPQ
jgi:hypothetical protein